MVNTLDQLRDMSVVVADTGDIEAIQRFEPQDATTNPSLILKAFSLDCYKSLIDETIATVTDSGNDEDTLEDCVDLLIVKMGVEILRYIPGRVSTEVDSRLSFDTDKTVKKAQKLILLYEQNGVSRDRVLIKIAATWEGIKAAEILEKIGINCNLTLLFSFAQARACAEAGVYLISPFVGRILDWHKQKEPSVCFQAEEEPGVQFVIGVYQYYKEHGYHTAVMAASFRNAGEIIALAGCDRLTISPALLKELQESDQRIEPAMTTSMGSAEAQESLSASEFAYMLNMDAMAIEKLSEGIRLFVRDQEILEDKLKQKIA